MYLVLVDFSRSKGFSEILVGSLGFLGVLGGSWDFLGVQRPGKIH